MPEGGDKLPAADLKRLADWIDLGAAYDLPLAGKDPISELHPQPSNHWSFRPIRQPAITRSSQSENHDPKRDRSVHSREDLTKRGWLPRSPRIVAR